ncbi:MAG: pitrilysin family protein [Burkholderiaceae bacterium]
MTHPACDPDTSITTLDNGVRVVAIRLPHLESASVSVFVRSGSQHESRRLSGISHMVEHMAFKGTHARDCQRINLDAERLGAEVNAHTDKDHTAFHMRGLARHAGQFVQMLGDIVRNGTFPELELERERQVILQELVEDEDDPMSTAYKLFDKACFGTHALGQPVIGTRANIERFTRAELVAYVEQQYTGTNVVVGVAGNIDPAAIVDRSQAAFGTMPPGRANVVAAPAWLGGIQTRRLAGCPQAHVVLGYPIPSLQHDDPASTLAAALFGEGMSSPLMDELRERRGLVYYAACSADVLELCGQFVIEASTAPEHLDEFFVEVMRLLAAHTRTIDPVGLERARNQIAVRSMRIQERPSRRLEAAAHDLFVHGRVRSRAELAARVEAVTALDVRAAFEHMLAQPASVAIAGKLGNAVKDRVLERMTLAAR